jgi:hypothetical protein
VAAEAALVDTAAVEAETVAAAGVAQAVVEATVVADTVAAAAAVIAQAVVEATVVADTVAAAVGVPTVERRPTPHTTIGQACTGPIYMPSQRTASAEPR